MRPLTGAARHRERGIKVKKRVAKKTVGFKRSLSKSAVVRGDVGKMDYSF